MTKFNPEKKEEQFIIEVSEILKNKIKSQASSEGMTLKGYLTPVLKKLVGMPLDKDEKLPKAFTELIS